MIVPVYNAEATLRRCVDSILVQTFTDFELLLVDDGSLDSSGAICDEYAGFDGRIRVFHKDNSGVSIARNLGILKSSGEYLAFVDSDDILGLNYLESLSPQQNEDFIIDSSDDRSPLFKDEIYIGKDAVNISLSDWHILTPWGKLYKAEIVKVHRLLFDETLSLGEDTTFNLNYLLFISSLRTTSSCEYHYSQEVKDSLSKRSPKYEESLHKAYQVYCIGRQLSAKYKDPNIECLISKYAGITWTLWYSLLPYNIGDKAKYIRQWFESDEMLSLMRNYLICSESGKRFAVFYKLAKFRFYSLATLLIKIK